MRKFLPTSTTLSASTSNKGFTLIELLVVITIIAFLSVIGMVAFTNVQAQARDARRRADIDAIAKALEANRTDPISGTYKAANDITIYANGKVPEDPIAGPLNTFVSYAGVADYGYSGPTTVGANFVVCAKLEKGYGNYTNDRGTTSGSGATALYYCRKNQQ